MLNYSLWTVYSSLRRKSWQSRRSTVSSDGLRTSVVQSALQANRLRLLFMASTRPPQFRCGTFPSLLFQFRNAGKKYDDIIGRVQLWGPGRSSGRGDFYRSFSCMRNGGWISNIGRIVIFVLYWYKQSSIIIKCIHKNVLAAEILSYVIERYKTKKNILTCWKLGVFSMQNTFICVAKTKFSVRWTEIEGNE